MSTTIVSTFYVVAIGFILWYGWKLSQDPPAKASEPLAKKLKREVSPRLTLVVARSRPVDCTNPSVRADGVTRQERSVKRAAKPLSDRQGRAQKEPTNA